MMDERQVPGCGKIVPRAIWFLVFIVFGSLAAGWWFFAPQGFPIGSWRLMSNTIIPGFIGLVALSGLGAVLLAPTGRVKVRALFFPLLVSAAFITSLILFPVSFGLANGVRFVAYVAVIGGAIFVLFGLAFWLIWADRDTPARWGGHLVSLVLATLAGSILVVAQRSDPAATRPSQEAVPEELLSLDPVEAVGSNQMIGNSHTLSPVEGVILTECGDLSLQLDPQLTFISRSPDRFWTLFAPVYDRVGPARTLIGQTGERNRYAAAYESDYQSWLQVEAIGRAGLAIESYAELPEPIYSHLNSYTQLIIDGGSDLEISFSPVGETRFELMPFGYPFGAPARMAMLSEAGEFNVVEATNAEKGPFTTLASGTLGRGEPLALTIFEKGMPQCRLTFDDWSAQASTQLSPTAGWEFPENSIEFRLDENGTGYLFMSLASTSVGRGYDSVGHAAGIYRNRIRLDSIASVE